jgi:hypothetical protein
MPDQNHRVEPRNWWQKSDTIQVTIESFKRRRRNKVRIENEEGESVPGLLHACVDLENVNYHRQQLATTSKITKQHDRSDIMT